MNWEAVSAIGQVIGAVAVVATLIYLAIQIRQNNILLKEQAKFHMLQNQISYHDSLFADSNLVKTMYGVELSDLEIHRNQRMSGCISLLFRWNWEYLRSKEKIFNLEDVPVEAFAYEFAKADIGEFWDQISSIYDPTFVEFMNSDVIPLTNNTKLSK